MLNIIVCDDDALHCSEIVKSVQDALGTTSADISDFRDPEQLLQHLRETGIQPHIALLDICMPEQKASVWRAASSSMRHPAKSFSSAAFSTMQPRSTKPSISISS